MSTLGDIMSTSGDNMMHVGQQGGKAFQFILKTPMNRTSADVLMISSTCIMISPNVLNIP